MKFIPFACLSYLALLTFQAAGEPAPNEFQAVIEGGACSVKACKPEAPSFSSHWWTKIFVPDPIDRRHHAEIDSEKGRFLVYQLMSQGGKNVGGEITSSLRNVAGKWSIGADETEGIENFRLSLLKLVPAEFAKRHQAAQIEALPFEDLLK